MPRIMWGLLAATAALLAVGAVLAAALHRDTEDVLFVFSFSVTVAAFAVVGALIARRHAENPIGWLLAVIGLLFAIVVGASTISVWILERGVLPRAVGEWVSVLGNVWVVALGLLGTQVPLRLPDGRLPSPRWRWFSRATLVAIALTQIGMLVQGGLVNDVAGTSNPLEAPALQPLSFVLLLVVVGFAGSVLSLIQRYRRANGDERAQLRWVAWGGAVFLATYVVTVGIANQLGDDSAVADAVTSVAQVTFATLPVAIGYAMLKHRLYDIDVVVNRTLVYAALTLTLAATYVVGVLVLQLVLSPVTGDSSLAVAASTLVAAAVFRPARSRIQAQVDRRFFRSRYDAAQTLEAFAGRVRDEVALDALSADLIETVSRTVRPAHVSLWVALEPDQGVE
jgi:hypothetical protein